MGVFTFIFGLAGLALFIIVWVKIFGKAGYPTWYGFLMLVPILNLVMILILAFGEWPIEKESARMIRSDGQSQKTIAQNNKTFPSNFQ